MLELVNLISIGISNYNFKANVASDIAIDNNIFPLKTSSQKNTLKTLMIGHTAG